MIQISPFKALRPNPGHVQNIISVPYDVISSSEARKIADENRDSFLRVIRSEIDFPENMDPHHESVYERARDNFNRLIDRGLMVREEQPALYLYRLNSDSHEQTGIVCRVSVADYLTGKIKKHELTREEKEADRTKHIDFLGANTGPVFMAFSSKSIPEILELFNSHIDTNEPLYDITRHDSVRHRIYRILPGEEQNRLVSLFQKLSALYIADGHHRAASAVNVSRSRSARGRNGAQKGEADWFLAANFPDEQLQILPYNRVVKDLNGYTVPDFLKKIEKSFQVTTAKKELQIHEFGMYLQKKWYTLKAKTELFSNKDSLKNLDVSILQDCILSPLLGINDPRTSAGIEFVGGIRGDSVLEKMVDSHDHSIAFSLHPTTIEQLIEVADRSEIMPPKSTWFEPKLCSGFLVNMLD